MNFTFNQLWLTRYPESRHTTYSVDLIREAQMNTTGRHSSGNPSSGMISPFAATCRRIREERKTYMAEQARVFECSVSYISAVETGQKNVTTKFVDKFISWLSLNDVQAAEIRNAACISTRAIKMTPTTFEQLKLSKRIADLLPSLGPRDILRLDEILDQIKCKKASNM
jgi:transcriptional regulator with XRE-family HTH domain